LFGCARRRRCRGLQLMGCRTENDKYLSNGGVEVIGQRGEHLRSFLGDTCLFSLSVGAFTFCFSFRGRCTIALYRLKAPRFMLFRGEAFALNHVVLENEARFGHFADFIGLVGFGDFDFKIVVGQGNHRQFEDEQGAQNA
jgi:hypothetical protein